MISDKIAPRLVGAAFLFVFFASLISGLLLTSAVGSARISDILVNTSNQLTLMRLSILGQMVTSSGIVALAGLLYIVLHKQNKIIALVALGLWLAEAIFLAISQLGVLALLPVSLDFIQAGASQHSSYLTLGEFLYNGVYSHGITIHMWFYCLRGNIVVFIVLYIKVYPTCHLSLGPPGSICSTRWDRISILWV